MTHDVLMIPLLIIVIAWAATMTRRRSPLLAGVVIGVAGLSLIVHITDLVSK